MMKTAKSHLRGKWHGTAVLLVAIILALSILPAMASADTITVDDSGTAMYTTIQEAIDNANASDTIYVYNGTYSENVYVNKRVTLQGEGADVVTVKAASISEHVFGVIADYVDISGFTMTRATGNGKAGIYLGYGVDHGNISDNNVSGNNVGIYLYSSNDNTLTSNNANSNNYNGIYLFSSSNNNNLTSNNASDNNYGIYLFSSSLNTIYNNYFNNTNNAFDVGNNVWNTTPTPVTNIIGGSWIGGNYWSDYTGLDTDGDRLGDTLTPHNSSGNIINGDQHPQMTKDITPPNVGITVPADDSTLTTATTMVYGTMSADTANVTVYVNGFITNDSVTVTGTTYSISNVPLGADGVYEINVSATDIAGNVNTTTATVTVDTTAPILTIAIPVEGYNYSTGTVALNVTADETIVTWQYSINGTANVVFTPNITLPVLPDGDHNVTVYANDSAGNIGSTLVNFTVDTTAPTVSIDIPTALLIANKSGGQQMYVNFTYIEANPKNYTVQIRNATDIINSATATATSSPVNVSFTMNSASDGYYNVTVIVRDYITYTTATEVNAVFMDSTPPTAPSNLTHTDDAPNGYDNDTSVELNWSAAADISSSVIYSIYRDGILNASTTNTSYTFIGETEGLHEYNVSAKDSFGNINPTNASVTVIVDYTDPVIHNLSLSDISPAHGQQIIVSVNVTDTNIASVTAGSTSLTHQSGMLWNGTITAGYGANNVTVTVYDNASNNATNSSLSYTGPAAPKGKSRLSSGGGGGGAGSDEPSDNIEYSVFIRLQLTEGQQAYCNFDEGPVESIGIMPLVTYGLVTCKVEVLYGQSGSTEGTELPDGFVFQYLNIYLGNSGWYEGRISNPVINFVIPAGWFEENNIDPSSVTMYRYHDGEWQQLETTLTVQEGGYYQYSVQASGFSPFVIIGQPTSGATGDVSVTDTPIVAEAVGNEVETTPEATKKGIPGFGILLGAMGILIAVYARKK